MSMIFAYGKNMDEVHKSYIKQVNNQVFNLLESLGYEVERTNEGAAKLMKEIRRNGKKIIIDETNRKFIVNKSNLNYSCDVKVRLLGGD